MNEKEFNVNQNLKAILNEGKNSTFSLTNLFDSAEFKKDEDKQEVILNSNDELPNNLISNLVDLNKNENLKDYSNDEDKFNKFENNKDQNELDEDQNQLQNEDKDQDLDQNVDQDVDQHYDKLNDLNRSEDQFKIIKENFFFSDNDERFERLKFYDVTKIEKHNTDWNHKREQLIMVIY